MLPGVALRRAEPITDMVSPTSRNGQQKQAEGDCPRGQDAPSEVLIYGIRFSCVGAWCLDPASASVFVKTTYRSDAAMARGRHVKRCAP